MVEEEVVFQHNEDNEELRAASCQSVRAFSAEASQIAVYQTYGTLRIRRR